MGTPWKDARSVADLGQAMALWIEGRIPTSPTEIDSGIYDETHHLAPTLAACNRAGYVTTCSQPGHPPARGHDGRTYRQRAAVRGWIADHQLLDRIRTAAKQAGITVLAHRPGVQFHEGIAVTEANGQPCTWFGRTMGHRKQIEYEWPGIGRHAIRELRTATHLTLVDPEWGRDDVLWPLLDTAIGR